jgi:DNA-directed RNA polymerase subunit M/transcription elongation factor TFIIS
MKEKRTYICEKCGLEIEEDYQKMIDHEYDDHTEPNSYKELEIGNYDRGDDHKGLYPRHILVTMKNGAKVKYYSPTEIEPPAKKEELPLPTEALPEEKF